MHWLPLYNFIKAILLVCLCYCQITNKYKISPGELLCFYVYIVHDMISQNHSKVVYMLFLYMVTSSIEYRKS